ncbi:MAG TPA: ATP-binding protein [candidate division Zixibacteria bacterium]|nr:ATP-binding protein [candidate division Zixibacteria bacterium]
MSVNQKENRVASNLYVITEIARTLALNLELSELLQAVLDKITTVLEPAEFGVILFWDPSAHLFRPQAAAGPALHDRDALLAISLIEGESITGRVFAEGKAHLLSTAEEVAWQMSNLHPAKHTAMNSAYGLGRMPKCVVAAPLLKDKHNYGVLVLETLCGPACFSDDDLPLVQVLADLIALEIYRVRLGAEAAAAQQVQEEDRLRSEVMAALSHELRTPLASIKGYATALMLKEVTWPEEKRQDFLRLIDEETDNLERMVSDIMDASLIDIGQLDIEPQPLRLPHLAEEAAQEMQHQTDKHHFVVDFPPGFPIIEADPRRIRQVFLNILDNSVKYSPEGGLIVIRGEVRPTDVVVSFADQGVGISPEDLIPLFDKYFRVKAPTGYHVSGTGLGLPVVRAIVETHGGRVWAKSRKGEGTTLFFSIPLKLDEDNVGTVIR